MALIEKKNKKYNIFFFFLLELLEVLEKLGVKLPLEIIRHWSMTQQMDFYNQLCSGARYLDIRVAYDNRTDEWKTHHYLLSYQTIPSMLQDVKRFLEESTEEIVILEFSYNYIFKF